MADEDEPSGGSASGGNPASEDESRPAREYIPEFSRPGPYPASDDGNDADDESVPEPSDSGPSHASASPSGSFDTIRLNASSSGSTLRPPRGSGSIEALLHNSDDPLVDDMDPLIHGAGPDDPLLPQYVVAQVPSYDGPFGLREFGPAVRYCFWPVTLSVGRVLSPIIGVTWAKRLIGLFFFTILIAMYAFVAYATTILILTRFDNMMFFLALYIMEPIMCVVILSVVYGLYFFMFYFVLIKDIIPYACPRPATWCSDKFGSRFERLVVNIGRAIVHVLVRNVYSNHGPSVPHMSGLDQALRWTRIWWQGIRDLWSEVRGLSENDRVVNAEVEMDAF